MAATAGSFTSPIALNGTKAWTCCPQHPGEVYVLDSGEVFPVRCRKNRCMVCGALKAYRVGLAIGLADPMRKFDLTLVGDEHEERRHHVKMFLRAVRRDCETFEAVHHIEPNPKGTGYHLHGYQHGAYVPQRRLSAIASSVGMGKVVWIERLHVKGIHGYGMKMVRAAGYGLKMAARAETLERYLEANNGRLVHVTRNFWRDGTTGERLPHMRAAMAVALERRYGKRERSKVEPVRMWRECKCEVCAA